MGSDCLSGSALAPAHDAAHSPPQSCLCPRGFLDLLKARREGGSVRSGVVFRPGPRPASSLPRPGAASGRAGRGQQLAGLSPSKITFSRPFFGLSTPSRSRRHASARWCWWGLLFSVILGVCTPLAGAKKCVVCRDFQAGHNCRFCRSPAIAGRPELKVGVAESFPEYGERPTEQVFARVPRRSARRSR